MTLRPTTFALLILPFVLPIALSFDLYLSSVPTMPEALAVKPSQIQLTLSVFLYCFALGQLLIGPASDRFGRRKTLLFSLILFTSGSIFCALAPNFALLLTGRVLQAFGACGSQVIGLALVRDNCEGKDVTKIISFVRAGAAISPIMAPILGAYLQVNYGWQANFVVLSLYGISIFFLAWNFIEDTVQEKSPGSFLHHYINSFKSVLSHISFIYFAACAMAAQAVVFGYFSLAPRYYMRHFDLTESQFALLFSLNSCLFLLTGILGGKFIIQYLGCRRTTWMAAIILILSGVVMYAANYFYSHHFALFLPYLMASTGTALMGAASAAGAMMPFKQKAGTASALFGCVEFMGGCLLGTLASKHVLHSVLPYASWIILLGGSIIAVNILFNRTLANKITS